ncbi:MAG: sigma-70 family RNA polymerase sigma factor [Planctomycetes bacterium]|nr:sigma-70 family RNA polymerase sigma factor [Planctomycetota bacterium]
MNDEASLIDATLAGDTAAFGTLVTRHQDRLYNSLLRVLGSSEDARDMVQEAFVQAFLKLESFRGSSAFYTWLYRIAFNLAMSHTRRRRPTQSLDTAKSRFGCEPADGQPTPEANLAQRETVHMVHAAMERLSAEYRQILVLREIEECRYEQIADILELPIGTVRSRLFRARLELRNQLMPMMSHAEMDGAKQPLAADN